MRPGIWRLGLLLLAALALTRTASANVRQYVAKPQPEFRWSKQGESTVGTLKVITLKLRSQVWREIPWDHTLQIYMPKDLKYPRSAMLFVTGDGPGLADTALGATLAPKLGAPLVIVYNTPNQPLLEGKREDDLIAHTFEQYLRTGDESWPLLFPMVRTATAAMDAVQELSKKEWDTPVEGFVVTGASKRGWTTWLTGAVDPRVQGIAPMVFDNLNFNAQMPRQLALWGKYSEQIDDYSRRGLQQQMASERGKRLLSMVDPWSYRKQLGLPKLLIHGTNDRYWATDATRAYWDELEGEKHLLAVPNSGHGLDDRLRVIDTITAFFHSVASKRRFPDLTHRYRERKGKVLASLHSDTKPVHVRLWTARATDLDFRPMKWESSPVITDGKGKDFQIEVDVPASGGIALFLEAELEEDGRRFMLSTPPAVFGKRPEAAIRP
jgi:PhoPQ-activated pathogenicity-related protein